MLQNQLKKIDIYKTELDKKRPFEGHLLEQIKNYYKIYYICTISHHFQKYKVKSIIVCSEIASVAILMLFRYIFLLFSLLVFFFFVCITVSPQHRKT